MIPPAGNHSLRRVRPTVIVTCIYVVVTLAYTWPLPINLGHGISHDPGDPVLNTWILWWTTRAVPLTQHWWNAPAFYPVPGVLAFSEHLLGLAPLAAPLIALTQLPLLGYNVTLLATFVLSGLGAHFLGYTLTKRHDAALIAGLAYAFAPYRVPQLAHIQVLASHWAPVCLAFLHIYGRDGRLRWVTCAAAAWLLQALSCGYYFFFFSVLLALWLAWFATGRWQLRRIIQFAAAFAGAAVLLSPILYRYKVILHDTYGMTRTLGDIREFSANVAGLLYASPELLAWGWLHPMERHESELFPGLTIVVLGALAFWRIFSSRAVVESPRDRWLRIAFASCFVLCLIGVTIAAVYGTWRLTVAGVRLLSISRIDKPLSLGLVAAFGWLTTLPRVRAAYQQRSALAFYLIAAFVMWVCALGPEPAFFNTRLIYQAPYTWLMRLPGFDGLRVPARFWMMSLVCLSAVAALVVDRFSGSARRTAVIVAMVGFVLDGWPREFTVIAAPDLRSSPLGVAARLDLPATDDRSALALYQQTYDPVPTFNGYSGYGAPHYYAMREMLSNQDPRILQALTANRSIGVIIDHQGDPDGTLRRYVARTPGARLSERRPGWSSYRLPVSGAIPLPDREGTPLPIQSLVTFPSPPHAARALDGDLTTRWSGALQQQSADMIIGLEAPSRVGQVVLDLGIFVTDFPSRLQIDVSADGTLWEHAWKGDTALHAYYGAIRHPREVPLVFPLNHDHVRFIRLRQVGFGAHDWSVAEVHVLQ